MPRSRGPDRCRGAEEPRSRGAVEPRRDRIGTSAVANTTPHGAGALKIGIRGALKTGIAHAVRERRLGRIHCARDVLICWHRRWHRRQAVHTSLHGGVALKSGLAAGIVQLRVGNDGVRRVLGTATDRATDSLVRHREGPIWASAQWRRETGRMVGVCERECSCVGSLKYLCIVNREPRPSMPGGASPELILSIADFRRLG